MSRDTFFDKVSKKLDEIDLVNKEAGKECLPAIGLVVNLVLPTENQQETPASREPYHSYFNGKVYEVPWLFRGPDDYNVEFIEFLKRLIDERGGSQNG